MTSPRDFRFSEDDSPESLTARWNANLAALRTLEEVEREGRQATSREQAVIRRFAGYGDTGFNKAFQTTLDPDNRTSGLRWIDENRPWYTPDDVRWARRGDELRELLDDEEYASIRNSRTTAFYTSPHIVDAMWEGVEDLGVGKLDKLRILEPAAGSGRFIGRQPEELRDRSTWTAVEKDAMTARLLRHGFEDVDVRHSPFEETVLPDDGYDLVISNPPFGAQGVTDAGYLRAGKGHLTRTLHGYFAAKGLDKVRPGGIVAYVTTHNFLDRPRAEAVRETLAEEADLLGAIRLPKGAFPDTKVVTDIIFLRKRLPGEAPGNREWVQTEKVEIDGTDQQVNKYFLNNPRQVLGTQSTARHGMREEYEYTVLPDPNIQVASALEGATERALRGAPDITPAPAPAAPAPSVVSKATVRKVPPEYEPLLKSLTAVQQAARRQVELESGGASDAEVEANREVLQNAYLTHVERFGAVNSPDARALMGASDDRALLFALENYDKASDCWRPSDILGRRVIAAGPATPQLTTPSDALAYHLQVARDLDFDAIGARIGLTGEEVRDALAAVGQVFKKPRDNQWVRREEYLSGDVREKLAWAQRAAANNPEFQANVTALAEVQPTWVGSEDISVPLGAPWVPAKYVNQWIAEELRINAAKKPDGGQFFAYSADSGRWRQRWLFPKDFRTDTANQEYGTPKVTAQKIIEKILTGGSLQIGDKMTAEDVKLAQAQARQLQESWENWLWRDADRTAELERTYNMKFNAHRTREYPETGYYPGMSTEWQQQLHPFQKAAINRIVSEGTTLLAHEVGFGKTASMIGSAMERQRLGLTEKPVFVVPKATHAQFQDQFMELYPGANILAPQEGEFTAANREEFVDRIATGDWDAVILTGEQFEAIPLSVPEERRWVESEVAQLQAAMEELEEDEAEYRSEGQSASQKAVDTAMDFLRKRLKDRMAMIDRDEVVPFDKLGIDALYVDEADRYKNLQFRTSIGGMTNPVKGMPSKKGSGRAYDMYSKIHYLQNRANPGVVVFATGTPIANSLAESWTMMRYLQEPSLREKGLHHFDAWAATFANMEEDMEMDAAGRYKMTKRFRDFENKPELAQLFQQTADIRVIAETPSMQKLRPQLAGGRRIIVTSPRDPQLDDYMTVLVKRAENLPKPPRKGDDNMLKVLTDGRKASLDLRLVEDDGWSETMGVPVGSDARPYPEGKLVQVARNVARIHEMETPVKGVQLVFLDMGTPKAVKDDDQKADKEEEAFAEQEAAVESGIYRVLKERMVDQGVPEDQVVFIHDYKTDDAREDLFDEVRKGNIRVVIGSTEKMGVGVNIQDRAAALHHVDAPWRPRDIEQREGRIIRQGNVIYGPELTDTKPKEVIAPGRGVQVYQYVQKGGLDEFMWQALEEKGRGIKGFLKRHIDPGERRMQEIDSLVLTAADTKAAASANPLVKKDVELSNAVRDLQTERKAHGLRAKSLQEEVGTLEGVIQRGQRELPGLDRDAAHIAALPEDAKFAARVGNANFYKAAEAGEALAKAILALPRDRDVAEPRPLGEYKGFRIGGNRLESGYRISIEGPGGTPRTIHLATRDEITPAGVFRRIGNRIDSIPEQASLLRSQVANSQERLGRAREEAAVPWDKGADLYGLEQEQQAVRARLQRGETGDEENVVYGLQSLPVTNWTPGDVGRAEERVIKAARKDGAAAETPAAPAPPVATITPPPAPAEPLLPAEPPALAPPESEPAGVGIPQPPVAEEPTPPEDVAEPPAPAPRRRLPFGITREEVQQIPPLGATDGQGDAAVARVKFFSPYSNFTWYVTELDPQTGEAFGLIEGQETELGYFSLHELESVMLGRDLPAVERDLYWREKTLGEIRGGARAAEIPAAPSAEFLPPPPPPVAEDDTLAQALDTPSQPPVEAPAPPKEAAPKPAPQKPKAEKPTPTPEKPAESGADALAVSLAELMREADDNPDDNQLQARYDDEYSAFTRQIKRLAPAERKRLTAIAAGKAPPRPKAGPAKQKGKVVFASPMSRKKKTLVRR